MICCNRADIRLLPFIVSRFGLISGSHDRMSKNLIYCNRTDLGLVQFVKFQVHYLIIKAVKQFIFNFELVTKSHDWSKNLICLNHADFCLVSSR